MSDDIINLSGELNDSSDQDENIENTKKSSKSRFVEFFNITKTKDDVYGICKICEKSKNITKIKMKNRNTSGLKKHLSSLHGKEFYKMFPEKTTTTRIDDLFRKFAGRGNPSSNKTFSSATVDWISKKFLPFSFFDDKETQDYFRLINPKIEFPSRFTIRREVQARFNHLRNCVKTNLQACTSKMSFTIDGWTSIANRSFYGITVHFIDNDWKYQSLVLDFVPSHGQHTGKDIAKLFFKCMNEFGLTNKIQGITVDNASANTLFMKELQKLLPDFDAVNQHFRCIAHILNLGVQDLMKTLNKNSEENYEHESSDEECFEDDPEDDSSENLNSGNIVIKIRLIFKKIKRSEKLNRRFAAACETANVPTTVTPILDCPTRWNSTHDMIGIALKLKNGIITLCNTVSEFYDFKINEDEWVILERIHKFLINFKNLTNKLSGDKYVTLPLVIVSFNLLLDRIETVINQLDSKIIRTELDEQLLLGFQSARDKMLKHYRKTNWIYGTTLILDPKHKIQTFDLSNWGLQMKSECQNRFTELYENYRLLAPDEGMISVHENSPNDEDAIDFNILYSNPSSSSASQVKKELEEYFNQPRATSDDDILHWWRRYESEFPTLAKMARDFLSISATSVPAERLFSKASLVIRKHRNRLNSESARWLLCINSWASIENQN